jgi:signal transduction histidine kinase
MNKFWNYISFLGIDSREKNLYRRTIILNNQMNFVMLNIMILLYFFITFMNLFEGHHFGMGSIRVLLVIILNIINLSLAKIKYHQLSKLFLIFFSPFIFLILPTILGFVEEESFTYYPFVLIGFSILPQLLLIPTDEKNLYILSLIYYTILLLFIDLILFWFMPEEYKIVGIMKSFFVFFKVAQILIFGFINLSVFYLRRLNTNFETELKEKNDELDAQNEELKTVLEDLKETQSELIRSEKMIALGTLTSGIAHEIKNPLNYIARGIHMIEISHEQKDEVGIAELIIEQQEALRVMKRGVDRAEEVINKMDQFTFKKETVLKPTFINELIEETLKLMKPELPSDIQLIKEYHLNKIILSNPNKAHHIFLNIILNAVASLSGSTLPGNKIITIRTESEDFENSPMAKISIINTGPHIPAEYIQQIFDPFFTTKDPGNGVGLGLSIAYTFIRELKGDIKAENIEEGVRFTIYLPA